MAETQLGFGFKPEPEKPGPAPGFLFAERVMPRKNNPDCRKMAFAAKTVNLA
jgi:hypothetical protein